MWKLLWIFVNKDGDDYSKTLTFHRWKFGLYAVSIAAMGCVLIRTYLNSKLTHVYTIATIMMMYPVFDLLSTILNNWLIGCGDYYKENSKCPNFKTYHEYDKWRDNVFLFYRISEALSFWLY